MSFDIKSSTKLTDSTDLLASQFYTTKYTIRLQSLGSTPQLQQRIYKLVGYITIDYVKTFLIKTLKIDSNNNNNSNIYLYINNMFQPSDNQYIADLFDCFNVNNELIVSYCNNEMYG